MAKKTYTFEVVLEQNIYEILSEYGYHFIKNIEEMITEHGKQLLKQWEDENYEE